MTVNGSDKKAENTVADGICKIEASKNGSDRVTENGSDKNAENTVADYAGEIEASKNGSDRVTEVILKRATEKEYQVLVALTENPMATYLELAKKLSVSEKMIATRIKSLKKKGLLLREGNNKKGYWRIVVY